MYSAESVDGPGKQLQDFIQRDLDPNVDIRVVLEQRVQKVDRSRLNDGCNMLQPQTDQLLHRSKELIVIKRTCRYRVHKAQW